jgi:hypothetical protein
MRGQTNGVGTGVVGVTWHELITGGLTTFVRQGGRGLDTAEGMLDGHAIFIPGQILFGRIVPRKYTMLVTKLGRIVKARADRRAGFFNTD